MPRASVGALLRAILAAGLLGLSGCSGGGEPSPAPPPPAPAPPPSPPSPPASVEREISPALTNSALVRNLSPHFVINPNRDVPAAGRLFVMLPGTDAVPRTYREIVRLGAARGYHALGLTYVNDDAVGTLCAASAALNCAELVRREVITGEGVSPLVDVDPANSITGRLQSLLAYLSVTFPNEGWGQYLISGQIDFSRIIIAGHSQGSGHAAFFAKLRNFNRVVMFSGPSDTGSTPGSANPWASLPNVTPAARQFGFTHTADPLVGLSIVLANWNAIGISAFGSPVSVDGASPPFANSQQLVTSAAPNPNPPGPTASPLHGAPVVDAVTPRNAQGQPIFLPVWAYLAFP